MHERLFELTVTVAGYDRAREEEIKKACSVEWPFGEGDFVRQKVPGSRFRVMQASAIGTLFESENVDEVVNRLERIIWHVNGELCHVECKTRQVVKMQDCIVSLDYADEVLVG